MHLTDFAIKAKRQSLLASEQKNSEIDLWKINSDQEGWIAQEKSDK